MYLIHQYIDHKLISMDRVRIISGIYHEENIIKKARTNKWSQAHQGRFRLEFRKLNLEYARPKDVKHLNNIVHDNIGYRNLAEYMNTDRPYVSMELHNTSTPMSQIRYEYYVSMIKKHNLYLANLLGTLWI